jgi:hypothetical protein
MSFVANASLQIGGLNASFNQSFTITADEMLQLSVAVTNGSTNLNLAFAMVAAKAQCFCLLADVAMTVKTNSSSSPGNIFTLAAGVPFIWPQYSGQTFKDNQGSPATVVDVTSLYVTNASGTDGTLILGALVNSH